jgi:carbon storage regulator CsrA
MDNAALERSLVPYKLAALVLTRRIGETVVLELPSGEQIDVVLLEAKGSRGRIGIDAPPEVHIVREELLFDEKLGG